MQGVLILSPSFPPAKSGAGHVATAQSDPFGGFCLALDGVGAEVADGKAAVDPAATEGMIPAAVPALLWVGSARGGDFEAAMSADPGVAGAAVSPSEAGMVPPTSGVAGDVVVASATERLTRSLPVSPWGASGAETEILPGTEGPTGQMPCAPGDVEIAAPGIVRAEAAHGRGGEPYARDFCPEQGPDETASSTVASAAASQVPLMRPAWEQPAASGRGIGGSDGADASRLDRGLALMSGERWAALPTGKEAGPDTASPLPTTDGPDPPDSGTLRNPALASRIEMAGADAEATAGDEEFARVRRQVAPTFAPTDASVDPGRKGADRPPRPHILEGLLSGSVHAIAIEESAIGPFEEDHATKPEDRTSTTLVASPLSRVSIMVPSRAPALPDISKLDAEVAPTGGGAERFATAETPAIDAVGAVAATAHLAVAAKPGQRAPIFSARGAAPDLEPTGEMFGGPSFLAAGAGAQALPGTLASPAAGSPPLPVPQLVAHMATALSPGSEGETELALSPEELGHVRVNLKPDDANPDRLVVMITFERPETLDLFRRHAAELADAFRSAGYAGADIGFGQQGDGRPGPDGREGGARSDFDGVSRPDPAISAPASPHLLGAASLDLRL